MTAGNVLRTVHTSLRTVTDDNFNSRTVTVRVYWTTLIYIQEEQDRPKNGALQDA